VVDQRIQRNTSQEDGRARTGRCGEGADPLDRLAPALREMAERFEEWLETARLEVTSRRYYENAGGCSRRLHYPVHGLTCARLERTAHSAAYRRK
jgi:hypothetical protein